MVIMFILSGCTPGGMTPEESASASMAARNEAACACLEIWVNTEADQATIDEGLNPPNEYDDPTLWMDASGYYHVYYPVPPYFDVWITSHNVGFYRIIIALNEGLGCPFSQTP